MQILPPLAPDQRPPIPAFTPVPRKYRHDGWTPERQRAFIEALAATGSVTAAAARINMSPEGAYYLRRQPGAEGFAAAWAAALDHGVQQLADVAIDRAIHGVAVPVFWRGEQVGEKRWFNDRLLMFLLRHHLPERYGPAPALPVTPPVEEPSMEEVRDAIVEKLHAIRLARAAGYYDDPEPGDAGDGQPRPDPSAALTDLDDQARAEIRATLDAHAERRRAEEEELYEEMVEEEEADAADGMTATGEQRACEGAPYAPPAMPYPRGFADDEGDGDHAGVTPPPREKPR